MSFTSNALLLGCTLFLMMICFGPIFLLRYRALFTIKNFMIGILCYIVSRGFILPFISSSMIIFFPNYTFVINLILLSLGCVFIKLLIYKLLIKESYITASYISAGNGEAFAEIVLAIFPIFINALSYSASINNGTLTTLLADSYTIEETNLIIQSFINTPNTYYLSLIFSSIILLFIHVTTAVLIQKKVNILLIIGFCLGTFSLNYILPSFSFILYMIFLISCIIFILIKGRKYIKYKK